MYSYDPAEELHEAEQELLVEPEDTKVSLLTFYTLHIYCRAMFQDIYGQLHVQMGLAYETIA